MRLPSFQKVSCRLNFAFPQKMDNTTKKQPPGMCEAIIEEMQFFLSHKVRKPITSAHGLALILKQNKIKDCEKETALCYLIDSIHEMQEATREMNLLLEKAKERVRGAGEPDHPGE
ncbi:MAG TPA: hypothetical protein VFU15_05715 [Bacteroidia bacterium]|nr:hypothetical protein [Bacteroidia bacterium]